MPSSTWRNIETFVEIVVQTKATSLLDIGVGNGKWGFLFREYSDVWQGHFLRNQWTSTVDGVEIYQPYIAEHQRAVYSRILVGDAAEVVPQLGAYDLIMAADVIEHLPKDRALQLIGAMQRQSRIALVASLPLGAEWLGERPFENRYESHLSAWSLGELARLGFQYFNIVFDADGRRRIGFFVHAKTPLHLARLRKLHWWHRHFA